MATNRISPSSNGKQKKESVADTEQQEVVPQERPVTLAEVDARRGQHLSASLREALQNGEIFRSTLAQVSQQLAETQQELNQQIAENVALKAELEELKQGLDQLKQTDEPAQQPSPGHE